VPGEPYGSPAYSPSFSYLSFGARWHHAVIFTGMLILMSLWFFALVLQRALVAAPSCDVTSISPNDAVLAQVKGVAKGFDYSEPVFVTVTNGGKRYTTQPDKDGRWELLFGNFALDTSLLCWQGELNSVDAAAKVQ